MSRPHSLWLLSLPLCLLLGCATLNGYAQLPPEEQGLYRAYSRIMTSGQLRTYLALPTAADRAAYAQQVGAAQVLEALSAEDRAAVLGGHPFVGMSRQALLLLWGEPYLQQGPVQYERWYYYGDYFSLASPGYSSQRGGTVMEVALENGKLAWWEERVPSEHHRSIIRRRALSTPAD